MFNSIMVFNFESAVTVVNIVNKLLSFYASPSHYVSVSYIIRLFLSSFLSCVLPFSCFKSYSLCTAFFSVKLFSSFVLLRYLTTIPFLTLFILFIFPTGLLVYQYIVIFMIWISCSVVSYWVLNRLFSLV